ncbi:hypothetical protein K2173_016468 [Erythroxylum novogranatense]|uniref:Uncharacterized protein n=1 Tax=Erythroxylum novogranatense TaxID=1862640 RepID=A0AAV8SGC7_9ROSI|nr:hypothetical protein K2173_016468 [Erythroxylum novogranatense]
MSRNLFYDLLVLLKVMMFTFMQRRDGCSKLGLSSLQKVTTAFRMLVYGVSADSTDEYIKIGESIAIESTKSFCRAIVEVFGQIYLKAPNANDVARLLQINEGRAWAGQYSRRSGFSTIIHKAVTDYDLWICHVHSNLPGSNNDINALEVSHLFANLAKDIAPSAHYVIQGKVYDIGYYLVDSIYPKWCLGTNYS